MSKTQNVLNEIKRQEEVIKSLKEDLITLVIHPACSSKLANSLHDKLLEKGWIVLEYMIEKEGYSGFGMSLCKHKDEMTKWDKKFWNKHEGCVF